MVRRNKRIGLLVFCSLFVLLNSLFAQEYKYEIGGMAGTSFYMGDANKTKLYLMPRAAAGIVFRYNKSLRLAYKGNLVVGGVAGDTRKSGNVFPNGENVAFSRTFVELGGQIEYNFFNYSDKYAYLGTRRLSPYIFTGLGVTLGTGDKTFFGLNVPLGVGLKYKWKERLNLGFEFSFRKLFSDSFDVTTKDGFNLDGPYGISSGLFKNQDWYSLTMFSITWDFGVKKNCCNNSEF